MPLETLPRRAVAIAPCPRDPTTIRSTLKRAVDCDQDPVHDASLTSGFCALSIRRRTTTGIRAGSDPYEYFSATLGQPLLEPVSEGLGGAWRIPGSDDITPIREVPVAHSLLVDDEFWAVLEPLLPERATQRIGRPRVSDRVAFTAIVFVLLTEVPWRVVPKEIGCSGVTAWRLRDWQAARVWERLYRELLRRLNAAGQLDWSRGVVDASHIRALQRGSDRALPG